MTELEKADTKRWVEAWQRAAPELRRVREEDIRATETVSAIASFRGLASAAARKQPPPERSGLVEQQRWFRLLAQKA